MIRALTIAALLALGTSCWVDDTRLIGNKALDYLIDRPRVVSVRISNAGQITGEPRTIEALILSPDPIDSVSVDVCGLRDDVIPVVYDPECFSNPDAVRHIGDEVPLTWTPPSLERADCELSLPTVEDTAVEPEYCIGTVPLMVTVQSGGQEARGAALLDLPKFDYGAFLPRPPLFGLRLPQVAYPREEITIDALVNGTGFSDYHYFIWWVDAGSLRYQGRTGVTERNRETLSRNLLTIPDTYQGPLRVVVIAHLSSTEFERPLWAQETVEVR